MEEAFWINIKTVMMASLLPSEGKPYCPICPFICFVIISLPLSSWKLLNIFHLCGISVVCSLVVHLCSCLYFQISALFDCLLIAFSHIGAVQLLRMQSEPFLQLLLHIKSFPLVKRWDAFVEEKLNVWASLALLFFHKHKSNQPHMDIFWAFWSGDFFFF